MLFDLFVYVVVCLCCVSCYRVCVVVVLRLLCVYDVFYMYILCLCCVGCWSFVFVFGCHVFVCFVVVVVLFVCVFLCVVTNASVDVICVPAMFVVVVAKRVLILVLRCCVFISFCV